MSISSLFAGMEAYLDGDVEINNNVGTPDDTAAEDAEIAEQTAEVASDTADATEEAKDTEVASQMLSRMCDMYDHVKQFGIDRTFVSLYNRHGELDRVCGMQFPSCESMDVVGDCYSRYSTAFIAAMEDEKEGLWAKFKKMVAKIWNWIKTKVANIWKGIKKLFGFASRKSNAVDKQQSEMTDAELQAAGEKVPETIVHKVLSASAVAAPLATYMFTGWKMFQAIETDKNASVEEWDRKIDKYKKELNTIVGAGGVGLGTDLKLTAAKINRFGANIYRSTAGRAIAAFKLWRGQKQLVKQMTTLTDASATINDRIGAAVGIMARNVQNFKSIHPDGVNVNIPFTNHRLFTIKLNFGKWLISLSTRYGQIAASSFLQWLRVSDKILKH